MAKSLKEWEDKLLGIRKGFGIEGDVLTIAKAADSRPLFTYAIPLFGLLVFSCYYLLLIIGGDDILHFGGMLLRVFLFDYTIFLIAALSGFDSCRRWRKSSTRIEELSLSPMMPSIIGRSLIIGQLRRWLQIFIIFAVIEMLIPIPLYQSTLMVVDAADDSYLSAAYLTFGLFLAWIFGPLTFAWFHYESAHLAHWLFSQHALPRIKLINVGFQNFITINFIVFILSAVGSIITFAVLIFLLVIPAWILELLAGVSSNDVSSYHLFPSYLGWYLAAIPAALVVAWFKRMIVFDYEKKFTKSWLCYQWWGAGELSQPLSYPPEFNHQSRVWMLHYLAEEERIQDYPDKKRKYRAQYEQALNSQGSTSIGQSLNQKNNSSHTLPQTNQFSQFKKDKPTIGIQKNIMDQKRGTEPMQAPQKNEHQAEEQIRPDGTLDDEGYNDQGRPDSHNQ